MKQLIVPIAIIITLIAFFVIIDRKEFSRHDDVQTVQRESPTSNRKPTVSLPETKPLTEKKPVSETKPVAEAKPMTEAKPVAETKPQKPEEKLLPAAVPVVTAEEAEKLNEYAVFLSTVKKTVVEGEITERSDLPDPQKSDYPNCRFTVHFTGNTIKSGEPCPKELSLIVEGFENYHVLPNNDIKKDDKILCTIFPFDQLPEDYQSTQQADDLELYLLDQYYVLNLSVISSFTDYETMPASGIFFSDENKDYVSLFKRHINPPIPQSVKDAQANSIKAELEKMNELLSGIDDGKIKELNSKFATAWELEKKKDPEGFNRLGEYVWRNIDNSFWTLPAYYSPFIPNINKLTVETIDSFVALKDACEANGVQLIVALVPNNNVVSSRIINAQFRDIPDIQMATYVKQLSENGVEAIYTTGSVIKNYNRFELAFNFPQDIHPADTTQDVIAELIAQRINRFSFKEKLDESLFTVKKVPPFDYHSCNNFGAYQTYSFPEQCDIADHHDGESFMCRKILFMDKNISNTQDSPILMIGNSFMEAPVSPPQSAPSILSYKTLLPVNWNMFYAYGPFTELLVSIFSNPVKFLSGKKVLICYYGTDHVTYVNRRASMVNIRNLDCDRALLNNKKKLCSFILPSMRESIDEKIVKRYVGILQTYSVMKTGDNGEWTHTIKLDSSNIDYSKPITCIIPTVCGERQIISMTIGDQTKHIPSPSYVSSISFYNLAFELPVGTKEVSITARGNKDSLFVIKDIQIWQ